MADYQNDASLKPDAPPLPEYLGKSKLPPATQMRRPVDLTEIEQAITPPASTPYAPPPRFQPPVTPLASRTEIKFVDKVLTVSGQFLNEGEANEFAKMVQAVAPFLPKGPAE